MSDEFKNKLVTLGLTDDQIAKLATEGCSSEDDLRLLTAAQIKEITGCGVVTAEKVVKAFALQPATPFVHQPAGPGAPPIAEQVIPDGAAPSPAQVQDFASSLNINPMMLMMFMNGGGMADSGIDLSGMIPIPTLVEGYNPKFRNMNSVVLGQIQNRFGGNPIIVIDEDGAVNKVLTVEYIMGLEEGREYAEGDIYDDAAGVPHQILAVGVDAQSIYPADPLDSSKALTQHEVGLQRVCWKGVSLEARQVVYFAVTNTREIDPANDAHGTWLRDHIKPGMKYLDLAKQAPKALTQFNAALRTGSLPTLRVMLSRQPRRREIAPRRRTTTPRTLDDLGIGRGEDRDG